VYGLNHEQTSARRRPDRRQGQVSIRTAISDVSIT
jgi:hypothetical protein